MILKKHAGEPSYSKTFLGTKQPSITYNITHNSIAKNNIATFVSKETRIDIFDKSKRLYSKRITINPKEQINRLTVKYANTIKNKDTSLLTIFYGYDNKNALVSYNKIEHSGQNVK